MPCELRIRDDMSINDITHLAKNHLVKVTPHVGNWTPARLVLPTLGISILCVDHTIGSKDPNAHPHLLIRDGVAHVACDHAERLTTHAYVTEDALGISQGTSLSKVHIGAIRSIYPSADIVTHSEHLHATRDVTLAVLEEATAFSRTMTWWRKVDDHGQVTCYRKKELPRVWSDVERNIFPLTDARKGWLVHNRVAILMDVILQSRMGKEPEIFHLSGPDMVRYLGGEMEAISRMYDHVRKSLSLPQSFITINLVPFALFRFATRTSQAGACERLCKALVENSAGDRVMQSAAREASDVCATSESRSYFTQHDALATGEGITVPEIARTWSMATCARYMDRVRQIAV